MAKIIRGQNPSAPGEYPRKMFGHLRRNVQMEFDAATMVARVGTNVKYGKYLETGTRRMAARPWLSRGLREAQSAIRRILGGGI